MDLAAWVLLSPAFSLLQREGPREEPELLTHPGTFNTWSEDELTCPAKWVMSLTAVPISQKLLKLEVSLSGLDGTLLARRTQGDVNLLNQRAGDPGDANPGWVQRAGGGLGSIAKALWCRGGCCISRERVPRANQ